MHLLSRWKLAVIAVMVAFAVALTAGTASAAIPGEESFWHIDPINNGHQSLHTVNVPGVAANGNNQLQAWQSNDGTGLIWASYNEGPAFPLSGVTHDALSVVPYGPNGFAIFHTGVDGHIYWAVSQSGSQGTWSPWVAVGNDTTPYTVSVTQLGHNSDQLYLVYRSNDAQRQVWSRFWDGENWDDPVLLGGTTNHSPAVTFNPVTHEVWVAAVGTDGEVYLNHAPYGGDPRTNGWYSIGGNVVSRPSITSRSDGFMMVSGLGTDSISWYQLLEDRGGTIGGSYQQDVSHFVAIGAVTLLAIGTSVYAYLLGTNHVTGFKRVWG